MCICLCVYSDVRKICFMSNYVCIARQKFERFEQRANKNVERIFAASFCKQRLLWIIVQTTSKELIRKRKQTLSVKRSHSFIYLLNVLICCFIKHNVDRYFFFWFLRLFCDRIWEQRKYHYFFLSRFSHRHFYFTFCLLVILSITAIFVIPTSFWIFIFKISTSQNAVI